MASRRFPLANNPNAANSPLRGAVAGVKRARPVDGDFKDLQYSQQPPTKKLTLATEESAGRRNVPSRKAGAVQTTRDGKQSQRTTEQALKATNENLESIRQWQRHYRAIFPTFVFYFESIPDDLRIKCSKQVQSLGAREEKFFSRAVTHVVTTRPIPSQTNSSSSTGGRTQSSAAADPQDPAQLRTINPSLLDRTAELQNQSKGKFTFEVPGAKKTTTQTNANDVESRRPQGSNNDTLYKAREMGIKIWALEKLQRMMTTMFNANTGEQPTATHKTRQTVGKRDADLNQLLQKEKLNGPADRDPSVVTKDMAQFRGFYIYIHDMDEKTKPVVVRDYPKVAAKEEGKWPQFRVTGPGRCPFVEDAVQTKRVQAQQQKKASQLQAAPRTRAAAAAVEATRQQAAQDREGRALVELNNCAERPSTAGRQAANDETAKPLDPPKVIPAKRHKQDAISPLFGSTQANCRPMPRYAGGQPIASGVQPSNITSAIRSQMISSTAAAPGARAGTSKELNQLQRKVLEKNSAPSMHSNPSSYLNEVRAAVNHDRTMPQRTAKRKAQENLTQIHEDMAVSEEEVAMRRLAAARKKKVAEKVLKPGYCENCREKFNDFDEHVVSRKHRKFAINNENWKELDELLSKLERPLLDQ